MRLVTFCSSSAVLVVVSTAAWCGKSLHFFSSKSFRPTLNKSHDQCWFIVDFGERLSSLLPQLFKCLHVQPPPSATCILSHGSSTHNNDSLDSITMRTWPHRQRVVHCHPSQHDNDDYSLNVGTDKNGSRAGWTVRESLIGMFFKQFDF